MAFTKVSREQHRAALITEIRYAIVKNPKKDDDAPTFTGRLKIPVSIVSLLGWSNDASLDVAVGDGDDAGWFSINPAPEGEKHRARFKTQKNGVGVYSSSAIVPTGTAAQVKTYAPEARLDEASKTLFVKLAA
jgi:hypothetical protein